MQTKTFSVKDGSLDIHNGHIVLWHNRHIHIASTNNCDDTEYLLPSILIRTPKTDEELAQKHCIDFFNFKDKKRDCSVLTAYNAFLSGRKSVSGEYHLTREDLELLIGRARLMKSGIEDDEPMFDKDYLISSLTPSIYPTTITVGYEDGKYYWETIKAEY